MRLENLRWGLTYDDVLLQPAASDVLPREVTTASELCRGLPLGVPFLSAAMDTVTGTEMALTLAQLGAAGVLHKNQRPEEQAAAVRAIREAEPRAGAALGSAGRLLTIAAIGAGDVLERGALLDAAGVDVVVVDSAHGHARGVIEAVARLKAAHPRLRVMAGNVATAEAALALAEAGADAVKVGIGPGSICTTRVVAGVGVPQLTAVDDVVSVLAPRGIAVIADGGIRHSGDVVKALAVGAATVMLGSAFAGCDEAPGELFEVNGRKWKRYRGMGSQGAMEAGSGDRYFQGEVREPQKLVAEGVEAKVPARGPVAAVLHQFVGGLRAGMGYLGARTLADLSARARFVRISPAGLRESHVHDVVQVKAAANYLGD